MDRGAPSRAGATRAVVKKQSMAQSRPATGGNEASCLICRYLGGMRAGKITRRARIAAGDTE
jgi:hypothetical protein